MRDLVSPDKKLGREGSNSYFQLFEDNFTLKFIHG